MRKGENMDNNKSSQEIRKMVANIKKEADRRWESATCIDTDVNLALMIEHLLNRIEELENK